MVFGEEIEEVFGELERGREVNWNIDRESAEFLYNLVVECGGRRILELGTSTGYSGIWLALAVIKNGGGEVITVESHAERFEKARRNFERLGLGALIRQVRGHVPEVLHDLVMEFEKGIDVVFLDVIKKNYKDCAEFVLPYLKSGALIVADNVLSHGGAVREFLDFVKKEGRLSGEIVEVGAGFYVGRVVN